jgi:predicted 3-demethylubiquinone-9 3-methyltransferase (glyoxalase superfamily)
MSKVTPFLMFKGNAEEAMTYYTSLIKNSEITNITRYGANDVGDEGTVMQATFRLNNQEFMCIDSNVEHAFTFTPSFSIFLDCDSEGEVDCLYEELSKSGAVLMALQDYNFSKKFGWVVDKFGISWQINLPK